MTRKRGAVDVYANTNYFGKTRIDSTIKVPAKDTFLLPVTLKVDMNNTAIGLIQTLASGADSVHIKLDGSAKIGGRGIFINYPIRYAGMQKIKF